MKLIELPHKVCGQTCMVNGLEDLYEWKTGVRPPDWFWFYMSGMAGFIYLKQKNAPAPRMVMWGSRATSQYEFLADIVGYTWQMTENRSFSYSFKRAKEYIDRDTPVILGAIDMYHLPYYDKFYHRFHVPIHYVMMVGYDDAGRVALVHDCDRAEVQEIPYTDLQLAWEVNIPGLSKKNTLFAFTFNDQLADIKTIARGALRRKADFMLNPPVSMFGLKGMRKLARELPRWPKELAAEQVDASLRYLAEYTGNPPSPPNRLTGYNIPFNHAAGRDGLAGVLAQLAENYGEPTWAKATALFEQSGQQLEALTDAVVDYILGEQKTLDLAAALVKQITNLEETAYRMIAA